MKRNHLGAAVLLVTGLFLGACSIPSVITKKADITLPVSYPGSADTGATVLHSWKNFFTDTNLVNLVNKGLTYNQDLQAALQRLQSAQAEVLLQKGLLLPTVGASVAGSLKKFGLYTMDGAGNIVTEITPGKLIPVNLPDYFMGIQTSWEIDVWGKLKNRKKAAVARYMAGVEGKNLLTTQIVSAIAASYYELLAIDHTIKIIDETILLQEKAYELVKAQKEHAASNELAVKQFESRLLNLRGFRVDLQQQTRQVENALHILTGTLPGEIKREQQFFEARFPGMISTGVPAALLQNRPDIRQAEWNVLATNAELQAARAAFYPSVAINGSLGFQAFKPDLLLRTPESMAYGLLGGLTAPLINRTALKASFQKANAGQLEAYYQYQKTILTGYVEVYNEMLRVKNLEQVFELKNKEVASLSQSIDIAELLFKAGRATYLEVLLTQQNALQAKLELVETKKKQFQTTVNLYKTLGGGWQ